MQILLYMLSSLILVLLLALYLAGRKLERLASQEEADLERCTVLNWPQVALIVPVAGQDPRIEASLTSLLEQNYPAFTPVFVTESATEPAALLLAKLKQRYPRLAHVVAGPAGLCGQKNHNVLAAIASLPKEQIDCYAFCDSTHLAKPDFLTHLIQPIARGHALFTTGYHEIVPRDRGPITLAYTASVLIMRLLQALSVFTQPWGGAMAIKRTTFAEKDIAGLWSKTVVDDCALVEYLAKVGVRVRLVAKALLATDCADHKKDVFRAWMERQILFPRFCVPVQWWLLGVMLVLFFMLPFVCLEDLCFALAFSQSSRLVLPLLLLAAFVLLICALRRFLPVPIGLGQWFAAFCRALGTFFVVYLGTCGAQEIVWHGKVYRVGRGGIVLDKRTLSAK
ncbi:MAG: glycosyltransferase [Desulfovibrio sp.]|nr:glycosyltransferase [Desulfovibrio sp.]